MIRKFVFVMMALLSLAACTADKASLPLAEGKPTLLFFYTEN